MKRCLMLIVAALLFMTTAAQAQGLSSTFGFGLGFGPGGGHDIVRINRHAREVLYNYLMSDYDFNCPRRPYKNKTRRRNKLPDICRETRELYIGSALPTQETHRLPANILDNLGFIEPGTDYRQRGFVIYLISFPRRIILDTVTLQDIY